MTNSENNLLNKLWQKQKRYHFISFLLIVLGLLCWLFWPYLIQADTTKLKPTNFTFIIFTLLILLGLGYYYLNKHFISKSNLIKHLNQQYPQLEYSTQLVEDDFETNNLLEQIQSQKIKSVFAKLYPSIKISNPLKSALLFILINVLAIFLTSFLIHKPGDIKISTSIEKEQKITKQTETKAEDIPQLLKSSIKVSPLPYTNIQPFYTKDLSLEIAEGSTLQWDLKFDKPIKSIHQNIDNKTNELNSKDNIHWNNSIKPSSNLVYQLVAYDNDEVALINQWHDVKILPDNKPIVKLENFELYQELNYYDIMPNQVQVFITDDYGINEATLNILKSSGEGESVKFEKESYPINVAGKNIKQQVSFNISTLKPEPGDEIFIRLAATDNCPFRKQQSFSNTHIIAIKDTAKIDQEFGDGLGLDIQPEYFRSQRQIIIDTEQLLSEQKDLTIDAFKNRSNNIAIDQKLLRLRYGKFLGEEFEGEIGESSHHNHEHEHHDDHDHHDQEHHDEDDEHDHSDDELTPEPPDAHAGHDHGGEENPDPEAEQTVEELLSPFVHAHDNADVNTFFESETKAKLKAALAQMWEAELQLRIAEPKKALPFENKALKLIKEVQQANRIYVERVGLEVREIKVDKKRLTGDISEVFSKDAMLDKKTEDDSNVISEGIAFVNALNNQDKRQLKPSEISQLDNLTKAIYKLDLLNNPLHLKALELIRQQKNESYVNKNVTQALAQTLLSIKNDLQVKTGSSQINTTELQQMYLDLLNN